MALTPCHAFFQFYVADGELSCQLYQRSADIFLGVPFNIASYALLTHMLAQQCDLDVGDFVWTGGDCHIYSNHDEQVQLQLSPRSPRPTRRSSIKRRPPSIFDYAYEDFEIDGYDPHRRSRRRSRSRARRPALRARTVAQFARFHADVRRRRGPRRLGARPDQRSSAPTSSKLDADRHPCSAIVGVMSSAATTRPIVRRFGLAPPRDARPWPASA